MNYIKVVPEIIVGLGEKTQFDNDNRVRKRAVKLHLNIEDWLGDDLLWNFPETIVTERLKKALENSDFTGFTFDDILITKDIYFENNYQLNKPLPVFYWMKINGVKFKNDFYIEGGELFLSERVLDYLRNNFTLKYTEIDPKENEFDDFIKALVAEDKNKGSKQYIYKDGSRFYKDKDGNLIEDN